MKKKRLFKILSNLEEIKLLEYAAEIKEEAEIIIIKNPEKSLAMIKMREPVKSCLFYIGRSEEHTSELQSHSKKSYAVFCLNTKKD